MYDNSYNSWSAAVGRKITVMFKNDAVLGLLKYNHEFSGVLPKAFATLLQQSPEQAKLYYRTEAPSTKIQGKNKLSEMPGASHRRAAAGDRLPLSYSSKPYASWKVCSLG